MKRGLSLLLCVVMMMSVFSVLTATVSAADVKDALEVTRTFKDGYLTLDVFLKKGVSVSGTVLRVEFDPDVLEPANDYDISDEGEIIWHVDYKTKNAYGEEIPSVSGIYTGGVARGSDNIFTAGFVNIDPVVTTARRGFMTFKFKVIDETCPPTTVKIYCVEFNSEDAALNIPKNEVAPQVLYTFSGSTMAPIKLTSVYSVKNGLRINWEKTTGAAKYVVYDMTDSGSPKVLGSTTKLYFEDYTVEHGETRYYTVRAFDAEGNRDSAYAGSLRGMYVVAPEKFTITKKTNGIKVDWSLVDGAKYYRIYRREIYSNGQKSGWTEVYKAGSTEVTCFDKLPASGKQYEYTIRAFTDIGACDVYKFATIWYYTAPTVKVTAVTGGVSVEWNAIDGADKYNVYRKYNGSNTWEYLATVDSDVTTYLDKTATSGRNIFYTARAFGAPGEGSSAFVAQKISYVGVPHLTSIANSVGGITVKWSSVQNAMGYRVYRRAQGERTWTYLGKVNGTSYVDKNVKNGIYYKYTVRTVFYSLFSNFESGLLIKHVSTPKITSIANNSSGIKTTWSKISGATGYRVYRRGAGETTWTYLGTVKTNTYTDGNVVKGNYYRYTVRAVSGYYSGYENGLYIKRS